MKKAILFSASLFVLACNVASAQGSNPEKAPESPELKHYMPLYLDMPAELNVRKGYKEIDLAGGYADFRDFSGIRALLEYDFSPVNNLGFEVEVPMVFVHNKHEATLPAPGTEEEGGHQPEEGGGAQDAMALRLGFTYSIKRFEEAKTTLAAGYNNELEFTPFKEFGNPVFEGNVYNPFVTVARIWGTRVHSMLYGGPAIRQEFHDNTTSTAWRLNAILSYRFGKGNKESFAGFELNNSFAKDADAQITLRPQLQLQLNEKLSLGIVGGIPVQSSVHLNGSGFIRIMYQPGN